MTHSGKAIIATAALVVLVGACGSSSSKSNSTSNSGGNGSSNNSSNTGSGGNALSDLVAKGKTADIKITYQIAGSGENTSFTLIQRGHDSVEQFAGTAIYNLNGKSTYCTGSGASATCTTTGAAAANPIGTLFTSYDSLLQNPAVRPYLTQVKATDQTIAGRSAKCVTLTGTAAASIGGSGTVCVDSSTGILLKAAGSSKGTSGSITATSVGSPSDSDFTLPATPQTIPNVSIPNITLPTNTP